MPKKKKKKKTLFNNSSEQRTQFAFTGYSPKWRYTRGGERWSWRACVPAGFSSNPNQTHLNQLIKVFRMQLGFFFLGFFRVGNKLCRRVALQDQRSPPLRYTDAEETSCWIKWGFFCVQKVFSLLHNLTVEPLMADGLFWQCFLYFSGPWQC